MKLTIIIYSNDPETIWNAFRLGNTAAGHGDDVTVFLLGKGIEYASVNSIKYNIKEQIELFNGSGGKIIGCGICCDMREETMPFLREDLQCELGSMQTLYSLTKEADRIITF